MSKSFKGRVVTPGRVKAEALVSHGGFNTLASFQMSLSRLTRLLPPVRYLRQIGQMRLCR